MKKLAPRIPIGLVFLIAAPAAAQMTPQNIVRVDRLYRAEFTVDSTRVVKRGILLHFRFDDESGTIVIPTDAVRGMAIDSKLLSAEAGQPTPGIIETEDAADAQSDTLINLIKAGVNGSTYLVKQTADWTTFVLGTDEGYHVEVPNQIVSVASSTYRRSLSEAPTVSVGMSDSPKGVHFAYASNIPITTAIGWLVGAILLSFAVGVGWVYRTKWRSQSFHRKMDLSLIRERRRLAAALHDGPIQELHYLLMTCNDANGHGVDSVVVRDRLNSITHALRDRCLELHPPALALLGLPAALEELVDCYADRFPDIRFSLETGDASPRLSEHVANAAYFVAREALSNAIKHADAAHIDVRLHAADGRVGIEVNDDGVGIPGVPHPRRNGSGSHFGLQLADQRIRLIGGKLAIRRRDAGGTSVAISVPAIREDAHAAVA